MAIRSLVILATTFAANSLPIHSASEASDPEPLDMVPTTSPSLPSPTPPCPANTKRYKMFYNPLDPSSDPTFTCMPVFQPQAVPAHLTDVADVLLMWGSTVGDPGKYIFGHGLKGDVDLPPFADANGEFLDPLPPWAAQTLVDSGSQMMQIQEQYITGARVILTKKELKPLMPSHGIKGVACDSFGDIMEGDIVIPVIGGGDIEIKNFRFLRVPNDTGCPNLVGLNGNNMPDLTYPWGTYDNTWQREMCLIPLLNYLSYDAKLFPGYVQAFPDANPGQLAPPTKAYIRLGYTSGTKALSTISRGPRTDWPMCNAPYTATSNPGDTDLSFTIKGTNGGVLKGKVNGFFDSGGGGLFSCAEPDAKVMDSIGYEQVEHSDLYGQTCFVPKTGNTSPGVIDLTFDSGTAKYSYALLPRDGMYQVSFCFTGFCDGASTDMSNATSGSNLGIAPYMFNQVRHNMKSGAVEIAAFDSTQPPATPP